LSRKTWFDTHIVTYLNLNGYLDKGNHMPAQVLHLPEGFRILSRDVGMSIDWTLKFPY
jgi:hypothetical protein